MNDMPGGFYPPPENQNNPYGDAPLPPGKKLPHFVSPEYWLREKVTLRRLSIMAGCAIILYIVFSSVYVGIFTGIQILVDRFGDIDAFLEVYYSAEFEYLFSTLYSVLVVGGPFFVIGYAAHKKGYIASIPMGKPQMARYLPVIVFGAFGICLLGNIVTSYLDTFVEILTGYELKMPEMPETPHSAGGVFLYFFSTAFVPALVEEMALRGIIMQPLRRYGDWFAVLTSAFIFGLMHCNLIQIPFAFIAGIAIGYAVIVTESLWTGVLIHFCNNAFSVACSVVYDFYGFDSVQYTICDILFYVFIIIGVICAIFFGKKRNMKKMKKSPLLNSGREFIGQPHPFSARISNGTLFKTYMLTVPMIIAILAVIYETVAMFMFS